MIDQMTGRNVTYAAASPINSEIQQSLLRISPAALNLYNLHCEQGYSPEEAYQSTLADLEASSDLRETSLSQLQVETEHYNAANYDGLPRLQSYAYQIDRTTQLRIRSAVEVGIGNGFTTEALRRRSIDVTTVDFDATLKPDIVASVTALPLKTGHADASLCFEVLEHLPFNQFVPAVKELARVSRQKVFLSVPDSRPCLRFQFGRGWQGCKPKQWMLSEIPGKKAPVHHFDGQHYWEVGKRDTEEHVVLNALAQTGLTLEEHVRLFENPYHHFFLLSW